MLDHVERRARISRDLESAEASHATGEGYTVAGGQIPISRLRLKTRYHKGGRAGEIRTRDLLNPIQAHYQAVLRPEQRF